MSTRTPRVHPARSLTPLSQPQKIQVHKVNMIHGADGLPCGVVVVGAGLSGLTAARRLVRHGVKTVVLEARDRVGGRTLTTDLAGHAVDLGGQFVGPRQNRVLALARELGVRTARVYSAGNKVLSMAGRRRTYRGLIPKVGLLALLEMAWTTRRFDRLAAAVPPERPWEAQRAAEWDGVSLDRWLDEHLWTESAKGMFRIAAQAMYAAEPRELSFLYFLFSLRAGDGFERMAGIEGGAQQEVFVGGAQQLSAGLARHLGDTVRLGEPVEEIEHTEHEVVVRTSAAKYRAAYAILALAPSLCDRIRFTPKLPRARCELQRHMVSGSVVKCVIVYDEPFWRRDGYSGEAIADDGLARVVFDDCSPDGRQAALLVFILGDAARQASKLSLEARRQAVLDALVQLFGKAAAEPVNYVDCDWIRDEWSTGCYVGLHPPGVLSTLGGALRTPCGRVHFAGSEAATRWPGYMDGAIESGERAADEVLARLGR
jgi:monoamine oxidase